MSKQIKKRLFVCCDGTWNRPAQRELGLLAPTNVVKFANAIQRGQVAHDIEQRVYYHPGVGASDHVLDHLLGGAFGKGLGQNIRSAYKWLCKEYLEGDEIYIVGFSRGAFTARSLAGMIAHCGLVLQANWEQVNQAYRHYQNRKATSERMSTQTRFEQFRLQLGFSTPHICPMIRFLGVWDTVGTLGIPQTGFLVSVLEKFMPHWSNRFHDLNLSPIVQCACQALAIDEQRQPFNATLWESEPSEEQIIKQAWFPGTHADVGGGYIESRLAHLSLNWMFIQAAQQGAVFNQQMLKQVQENLATAPMHDAMDRIYNLLGTRPRSLPALIAPDLLAPPAYGQCVHDSTLSRISCPPIADAPYRLTFILRPGEIRHFPVYARNYWNAPGIFLQKGQRYLFTATGSWQDMSRISGPQGRRPSLIQWFYSWLKRAPGSPWFALMASIANTPSPNVSADLTQFPTYLIGTQALIEPHVDGYVYFFANDMTGLYGNNRGSVTVTLRQIYPSELITNEHIPAAPLEQIEPGFWEYIWRWIGSAGGLALFGYGVLFLFTWLVNYFPHNFLVYQFLEGLVQSSGWLWFEAVFPLVVGACSVVYVWVFGRSDTHIAYIESECTQG